MMMTMSMMMMMIWIMVIIVDPVINPDDDENTVLVHDFISVLFNEHIGKVPNGDHNPLNLKI